jgi:ParB family chromosome partitioning protein
MAGLLSGAVGQSYTRTRAVVPQKGVLMTLACIDIATIDASHRLRPVDPDHAELIAASILERGLLTPLRVRADGHGGWVLIAGAHRLEALKALKWTELKVGEHVLVSESDDPEQAKLDEIDENLARHELNALDRALFLFARKKIFIEILGRKAQGGDRKSQKFLDKIKDRTPVFETNFAANTAKRIGLSKTVINDAIKLAEKLDAEAIAALRGTSLETNQRELFALAALAPEKQRAVAQSIRRGSARSLAAAQLLLGFAEGPAASDPQARLYAVAFDAWSKMDKVTRAQFLDAADLIYKPAEAPAKGSRK